jgi:hypothetical protein
VSFQPIHRQAIAVDSSSALLDSKQRCLMILRRNAHKYLDEYLDDKPCGPLPVSREREPVKPMADPEQCTGLARRVILLLQRTGMSPHELARQIDEFGTYLFRISRGHDPLQVSQTSNLYRDRRARAAAARITAKLDAFEGRVA